MRALLRDIPILAQDYEVTVGRGFVPGEIPRLEIRRKAGWSPSRRGRGGPPRSTPAARGRSDPRARTPAGEREAGRRLPGRHRWCFRDWETGAAFQADFGGRLIEADPPRER